MKSYYQLSVFELGWGFFYHDGTKEVELDGYMTEDQLERLERLINEITKVNLEDVK